MLNQCKKSLLAVFFLGQLLQTHELCATNFQLESLKSMVKTKGYEAFDILVKQNFNTPLEIDAYRTCFIFLYESVDVNDLKNVLICVKNKTIKYFCNVLFYLKRNIINTPANNKQYLTTEPQTPKTWARICEALVKHSNKLDLSNLAEENINLHIDHILALVAILFPNLKNLDLSSNQLKTFSGKGLTKLEVLLLSNNNLSTFFGEELPNLKLLYLGNNELILFFGKEFPSLEWLCLSNNNLTFFFSCGLKNLETLYLSNNKLTNFSGEDLPNLKRLTLPANLQGQETQIKATLPNNITLTFF